MGEHEGHLRGRCPRGGKHECVSYVPVMDEQGNALYDSSGRPKPGAPIRHGCAKCPVLAPNPDREIRFYVARGKYGFLSNLWLADIEFEGRQFKSSEHAYQFPKPTDRVLAEWMVQCPKPRFVALIAHSLRQDRGEVVDGWDQMKVDLMRRVLWAKFEQHPDLAKRLVETGDKMLIEDSKSDKFWGLGPNGDGRNVLGLLLMEARDRLTGVLVVAEVATQ